MLLTPGAFYVSPSPKQLAQNISTFELFCIKQFFLKKINHSGQLLKSEKLKSEWKYGPGAGLPKRGAGTFLFNFFQGL